MRFLDARYDVAELSAWYAHFGEILAQPGVAFVDLNEGANRLKVGLTAQASRVRIDAILDEYGIPREAVIFEDTEPDEFATSLQDSVAPADGGLQISSLQKTCTLGFNVQLTTGGQERGFVTNSHCTDIQGGFEATPFHQPSSAFALVGDEVADPFYNVSSPLCPVGRQCRLSDSAFVQYDASATSSLGQIARPGVWGSLTISNTNPHYQIVSPHLWILQGEVLTKVGRTTGKTAGEVTNTCYTSNVANSNFTLLCQYHVEADPSIGGGVLPIVDSGDSGSPVFKQLYTGAAVPEVALYGIVWGESLGGARWTFSSYWNVLNELSNDVGPWVAR